MNYTHWASGEPNNGGRGEHCLALWAQHGNLWNDMPCDYGCCSVCEMYD